MITVLEAIGKELVKSPLPRQLSFRIRKARLDDLGRLGHLWRYQRQVHESWDDLYATRVEAQRIWQDQIVSALNQPNHCVLIADQPPGSVLGYIHGAFYPWPFSPQQYYGALNTLVVAESAQKKGIGTSLIQELIKWFQFQQIHHISVHVDHRNQAALKLYRQAGFREYQHRLMLDLTQSV